MSNFSTAWKTWGSSKVWTDEFLGVPSTLQITVDKTQETWHSTSLQALPWFQRHGQSHLNSSDLPTKLTSNFSTAGGNGIWGVKNAPVQVQATFPSSEVSNHGAGGLLLARGPSLLFALQSQGRYQGKEMKYSEKAFKSKLNPINDSFKRSVPYIYKSTLMGLYAIWLLTFAVSQNTVQATWELTSSLKTPPWEAFWWGIFFSGDWWLSV